MRKKIIAGNWKMNTDKTSAVALFNDITENYDTYGLHEKKQVVLAPPFPFLNIALDKSADYPYLYVAAQNCSEHDKGAYTGEVSAHMLASVCVKYVLVGHSERRQYFNEGDLLLLEKIKQAQRNEIIPIFCCGEPLEIRMANEHFKFIKAQLDNCIFQLNEEGIKNLVIAYEPIWAIGTGQTASPEQAQEVHAFIREELARHYSKEVADSISILYGGSVNWKNAMDLFGCADIDGGLVGGASLKADEFAEIICSIK